MLTRKVISGSSKMVFGSREMVSGHRSMVLSGSDMPSALGLVGIGSGN